MTLRAGLIGLGMMGRHHARVLGSLDGVELVAVADPAGDPHGVAGGRPVRRQRRGAHRHGHRLLHGRRADGVPRGGRPRARRGRRARAGREAAGRRRRRAHAGSPTPSRRAAWSARSATSSGTTPRCRRLAARLADRRPRRRLPDRHPPPGPVPGAHRRRRRGQGPRHPRHRPHRLGDAAAVRLRLRADGAPQRPRARGPRRRSSAARRRHRHQPPGELARRRSRSASPSSPASAARSSPTPSRADLTFYANGTVATEWDAIAQFRGVSEGDVIRYAFAKPEPLRTEHEAFRDAVLGKESDIVTMRQGLATVAVAEAVLATATTGLAVSLGGGADRGQHRGGARARRRGGRAGAVGGRLRLRPGRSGCGEAAPTTVTAAEAERLLPRHRLLLPEAREALSSEVDLGPLGGWGGSDGVGLRATRRARTSTAHPRPGGRRRSRPRAPPAPRPDDRPGPTTRHGTCRSTRCAPARRSRSPSWWSAPARRPSAGTWATSTPTSSSSPAPLPRPRSSRAVRRTPARHADRPAQRLYAPCVAEGTARAVRRAPLASRPPRAPPGARRTRRREPRRAPAGFQPRRRCCARTRDTDGASPVSLRDRLLRRPAGRPGAVARGARSPRGRTSHASGDPGAIDGGRASGAAASAQSRARPTPQPAPGVRRRPRTPSRGRYRARRPDTDRSR